MSDARSDPVARPGLRVLKSKRFRLVLAAALAIYGIFLDAYLLDVFGHHGIWLYDYAAYLAAAQRMLDGASAFTADQLTLPIPAVCPGCYLYPPALAQLMAPLDWLSPNLAEIVWYTILTLAGLAAVWVATGIGGARASLERGLWTIVAVSLFMPIVSSNWLGNVSSIAALGIVLTALGGAVAGMAVAAGVILKVVAGAFVPAMIVAGRTSRLSLVISLLVLGAILFALAPESWLEYPAVLTNLSSGPSDVHWNLAPAEVARQAGLSETLVAAIRALTIAVALMGLVLSTWLARRPCGLPSAVIAATATMLLLPGSLWYHYLAVLLPFAAMAWTKASDRVRATLLLALAAVSFSRLLFNPVVILVGTVVVMVTSIWVLWPREEAAAPYHPLDEHA